MLSWFSGLSEKPTEVIWSQSMQQSLTDIATKTSIPKQNNRCHTCEQSTWRNFQLGIKLLAGQGIRYNDYNQVHINHSPNAQKIVHRLVQE